MTTLTVTPEATPAAAVDAALNKRDAKGFSLLAALLAKTAAAAAASATPPAWAVATR